MRSVRVPVTGAYSGRNNFLPLGDTHRPLVIGEKSLTFYGSASFSMLDRDCKSHKCTLNSLVLFVVVVMVDGWGIWSVFLHSLLVFIFKRFLFVTSFSSVPEASSIM